jgi:hypothetical protein
LKEVVEYEINNRKITCTENHKFFTKEFGFKEVKTSYYFPKPTAVLWYKLVKLLTTKILHKELWSYIGHSKLTKILPKSFLKFILTQFLNKHISHILLSDQKGAMLFIQAKK